MTWTLDPRTRVLRYAGDFPEPTDDELEDYGFQKRTPRDVYQVLPAHDPIAVERAIAGDDPPRLSRHDNVRAVRELNARGWSDGRIGQHMNITTRTVWRIRQRAGIPAIPAPEAISA